MKKTELGTFKPITDFEKLLFANDYIKALKKDISMLQFNIGVLISEKGELIDTSKIHRTYDAMKFQIKALEAKNKKLIITNGNLLKEIIKLKEL